MARHTSRCSFNGTLALLSGEIGTKSPKNRPLNHLNGVQVVGGSNPLAPTKYLASKTSPRGTPVPPVSRLGTTFVDTLCNDEPASELFHHLALIQRHQGISDRTLAQTLGISKSYLSYVRRGLRKLRPNLFTKIITAFPQLEYLFPKN